MRKLPCPWCADPDSTDDSPDPRLLCHTHLAEFEGLSVDQMDRRDRIQAAECE